MEEGKSNRFNGSQARWHGLLWLVIIVLVCVGWSLLLSGCSTKKCLASDTTFVSDSSVVRSTSSSVDSVVQSTSTVKESEKNHSEITHDSIFVSQVIERETIIRQDSSGKELSRETNTTITNNRDRVRDSKQVTDSKETERTNTDRNLVSKQTTSSVSVFAKKENKSKVEQTTVQQESVWTRIKNLFSFLWRLLLLLIRIIGVAFVVYVVGNTVVLLCRLAKKLHSNIKDKMKGNG